MLTDRIWRVVLKVRIGMAIEQSERIAIEEEDGLRAKSRLTATSVKFRDHALGGAGHGDRVKRRVDVGTERMIFKTVLASEGALDWAEEGS